MGASAADGAGFEAVEGNHAGCAAAAAFDAAMAPPAPLKAAPPVKAAPATGALSEDADGIADSAGEEAGVEAGATEAMPEAHGLSGIAGIAGAGGAGGAAGAAAGGFGVKGSAWSERAVRPSAGADRSGAFGFLAALVKGNAASCPFRGSYAPDDPSPVCGNATVAREGGGGRKGRADEGGGSIASLWDPGALTEGRLGSSALERGVCGTSVTEMGDFESVTVSS
jgi:hypothetical protein